jgi:glycosyltransferase involved in cell wall biosynthesis
MRILNLFSNWKWTGPAEPALNLAIKLGERGHDVHFACGRPPKGKEGIIDFARKRGIEPFTGFRLNKHSNPFHNFKDTMKLSGLLKKSPFDIIHSHMENDHLIAARSLERSGTGALLIRTSYHGAGIKPTSRNRWLFSGITDGLITVSDRARASDIATFQLDEKRVWRVVTGVDISRFNPERISGNIRKEFNLKKDDIVAGIVARVQTHRRFDVLLEAFRLASQRLDSLRLIIVGRGTKIKEIVVDPVERMGIKNKVVLSGYRKGDDYVRTLASMDFKVFLVPGSDGSCRAVKEAMAMDLPIIVSKRGMLPEIVEDRVTGVVINDTPENLADAIYNLATDRVKRKKMGANAGKITRQLYSIERQAIEVEKIYDKLLAIRS